MARKPGLLLRVDHRSYIRALEGPAHHWAWKQFADSFQAEAGPVLHERANFLFQRGFLAGHCGLQQAGVSAEAGTIRMRLHGESRAVSILATALMQRTKTSGAQHVHVVPTL